jgi:UDP-N-acetylmuramoylalanine--D-glutamate ligase
MRLDQLVNKRVAVWGYGVEGKATVSYLKRHASDLTVTVLCPATEADSGDVVFNHESVTAELLNQFDVVIKSPGISPYQSAVKDSQTDLISASVLWFSNERHRGDKSPTVVAITGTKGKSTACYLLHEALQACGLNSVLAGNFGRPLIACDNSYDVIVLETSSYQAQDGAIQADIAVLLNLYSEHLDWHGGESQYHQDKWRLLQQAKQRVINAKDSNSEQLLRRFPLNSFSRFNHFSGFYVLDDVLMFQDKALLSQAGWALPGRHNLENLAAVMSVIQLMKLDAKPALNRIKKCSPLPHRLAPVGTFDGVHVIDDSIASTPHATWAALQTVAIRRTVLLLGGFERGIDWQWFAEKIANNPPKHIICSGANGQRISQILKEQNDIIKLSQVDTLQAAVQQALERSEPGDCILLSPGAPSFDAFQDYQDRGQQFSQWIKEFSST